ncbi:hypothetical protein [Cysteiniphilum sp. 6C5]|uniref:hypothetical protein n=1 Tax=unclassified Cysteiniphilum TaxID=2610889 RepID=UPI003F835F98
MLQFKLSQLTIATVLATALLAGCQSGGGNEGSNQNDPHTSVIGAYSDSYVTLPEKIAINRDASLQLDITAIADHQSISAVGASQMNFLKIKNIILNGNIKETATIDNYQTDSSVLYCESKSGYTSLKDGATCWLNYKLLSKTAQDIKGDITVILQDINGRTVQVSTPVTTEFVQPDQLPNIIDIKNSITITPQQETNITITNTTGDDLHGLTLDFSNMPLELRKALNTGLVTYANHDLNANLEKGFIKFTHVIRAGEDIKLSLMAPNTDSESILKEYAVNLESNEIDDKPMIQISAANAKLINLKGKVFVNTQPANLS